MPRNLTVEELTKVYQYALSLKALRPKTAVQMLAADLKATRNKLRDARKVEKEAPTGPEPEDFGCEHGPQTCDNCRREQLLDEATSNIAEPIK
jgi:hypothetical protein